MNYINNILLVDDEEMNLDALRLILEHYDFDIFSANSGEKAIEMIQDTEYDVIISDVRMPGMSGLELLKKAKKISPNTEIIVITAYSKISDAVNAIKSGAFDYIEKPFSRNKLDITLQKVDHFKSLKMENQLLREKFSEHSSFSNIIGRSSAMLEIFETIKLISKTSATVLLQGKSGTGKEVIANAIHTNSNRADKNYVKLNCAALPENLIESELFGYEKGAFTGATKTHIGKFEYADKGTILLDEISEMRLDLQAKLLRFLQEKEFTRVGGNKPIKVNVRVIATSNTDLKELLNEKKFREDLYYRLNVVSIKIPSLNKRKEDIPYLADHFINKYCIEHDKEKKQLSNGALTRLKNHNWVGNVRELENTMEQAIIFSKNNEISQDDLNLEYNSFYIPEDQVLEKDIPLAELEKMKILQTLEKYSGNKSKVAEILGVTTRTLRNKLKEYEKEKGL
ncbi:MAG: sigma-54 dependent transcriptional regulator [Candidatus Cloacimonadota bacterium]|nr:sigma-54 dependent transcriptional regulator [Candidatus Cloacimonadota bacterium]